MTTTRSAATSDLLPPFPSPQTTADREANVAHWQGGALNRIADAADADLYAAYAESLERSTLGVDYYVAQEMERRGLRDPATAELTDKGRALAEPAPTIAYAVHVDGGMWDDRRISVWCADPQDALARLERASEFFTDDGHGLPLLTIVRAEFSPTEWESFTGQDWTRPALSVSDDVFLLDAMGEPGPLVTVMKMLGTQVLVDTGDPSGMVVGLDMLEPIIDCAECGEPAPFSVRVCPLHLPE